MSNLKALLSSESMEWETPQDFFNNLNKEFNFNLDPCATEKTAKCKKFYIVKQNGLLQDWGGYRIFCNPPYGREIKKWVKKCAEESKKKNTLVVLLIPARTDTSYFHDYIYKKKNVEIRFLRGRLKFRNNNKELNSAPFPSMVVIFK